MLYLVFDVLENAKIRTQEIARQMGCGSNPEDQTVMWFGVIEHPTDVSIGALSIPESDSSLLTEQEISFLKTYEEMDALGWFPKSE